MRATPKTTQQPSSVLDTPVKQRIVEQATRLFTLGGVNISTVMIAHFANTNVAQVIKLFGTRERLVSDFLKSLVDQAEAEWTEIERDSLGDPEAQLRNWMLHAEMAADRASQLPHAQLSRAAVDFLGFDENSPLLDRIQKFWQAERRKIVKLCEQCKFRDPAGLADKLLLVVQGARNERNCYGFAGPGAEAREAGDDLMVAHGAQRKPLIEV